MHLPFEKRQVIIHSLPGWHIYW